MASTITKTKGALSTAKETHGVTRLIMNVGSSSIRFALYGVASSHEPELRLRGNIDRIGLSATHFAVTDASGESVHQQTIDELSFVAVIDILLAWLDAQSWFSRVQAVGHRVVHGFLHHTPQRINPALLDELQRMKNYAPQHLPHALLMITMIMQRYPECPQVVCFDTAFHANMPSVARLLAIPRRYWQQGVQRYGFHGLSYAYLMDALVRLGDSAATTGRVILAHLGNGVSMAAVRDGQCIDTSMGFTPASGLMMSSRSGDLDPGLMIYLLQQQSMTLAQFDHMINHESGLLGVSAISADMRDLLAVEHQDERAADAIALFCYQAKKCLGAFAAALGGIDTIVFSGGIGEHASTIRARICEQLEYLGIELSAAENAHHAAIISAPTSRVTVRVIATDEAWMMARYVGDALV